MITQTTSGDHVCLFCAGKDLPTNLCAAGTWHAKITQVYRQHVDKISEQLRCMALFLNGLRVLSKLSSSDVASNELFYHSKSYKTFTNRYSAAKEAASRSEMFINNENEEFIKALHFKQIISYIYEQKATDAASSFDISELEHTYKGLLLSNNISCTCHVSRFSDRATPEPETRTIKGKLYFIFSEDIDHHLSEEVLEPSGFIKSMCKVVLPLRKVMRNFKSTLSGKFDDKCQYDSVPVELRTFISMLIDGPDITTEISQSALTCSQLIMTNFTPPRKKSVDKSKTTHSTERESPVAIYVALKFLQVLGQKP